MVTTGKKIFSLVFACLASFVPAFADLATTVDLSDTFSLVRDGTDGSFGLANFFDWSLDFLSEGNDNVKAELELRGIGAERASLEVKRAYVKTRFPWARLTAGKTRVSWGKGFFYNAGDVIFDSLSLSGSLAGSVLRDATDFMGVVLVPFDSFSFLEAVVLPNPVWADPGVPVPVDVSRMSYGGRIVAKLPDTEFEAGYFYDGRDITNRPYASFSGNLLFDWNVSASYVIDGLAPQFENWKSSLVITEGFSTLINTEDGGSLSLRLESVIRPFKTWIESTEPDASQLTYGIYIFPEVVYSPVDNLSITARSLVCPIDWSGVVFAGAYWNVYQGFTVGFLTTAMFGDDNDTYGTNREGAFTFSISLRYVFGSTKGEETK